MSNIVEFVMKMKDMMSGSLNQAAATSQSSFSRINQHAQSVIGRNRILGMSFNELQDKIRQVESVISSSTIPSQIAQARRELAALQRQSANHPGGISTGTTGSSGGIGIGGVAIGSMLGGLAEQAGGAIVRAVGSGVSAMISKSMEKEQAITGLTTFLGKQGATEAYNNIRKDADVTPFDTTSLLEVNRALISAGVEAKEARRDTMNLANAVSAVGGGNDILSRMAVNMQQIKTVGKATAIDIRQFGIAGINIYEMLARSTGKSIDQVKEMDVTYDQLAESLAMANAKGGIYEGALAAQSKTMSGKWSTVKDKFGNAASDIGDAFSPVINKFLDLGIKFASGIGPMLQQAQPYIEMLSTGIGKMVDYVTEMVSGTGDWGDWMQIIQEYWGYVWNIVKMVGQKLWEFVGRIVEFVKKSEILKDVFRAIGWIVEKVGVVLGWIMDGILWLWDNVVAPILEALETAYKWIKGTDDVEVKATKTLIAPKKPKDDPKDSMVVKNTAIAASNTSAGKAAGDTVTGGGPKSITINVGKFLDSVQFTTLNNGESIEELEKLMMEMFGRVLYNGSKLI